MLPNVLPMKGLRRKDIATCTWPEYKNDINCLLMSFLIIACFHFTKTIGSLKLLLSFLAEWAVA